METVGLFRASLGMRSCAYSIEIGKIIPSMYQGESGYRFVFQSARNSHVRVSSIPFDCVAQSSNIGMVIAGAPTLRTYLISCVEDVAHGSSYG